MADMDRDLEELAKFQKNCIGADWEIVEIGSKLIEYANAAGQTLRDEATRKNLDEMLSIGSGLQRAARLQADQMQAALDKTVRDLAWWNKHSS